MRIAAVTALALLVLSGCGSTPQPSQPAQAPGGKPLVREGQPGRVALGGRWLFRLDGDERWRAVRIPYDWNGSEAKLNKAGVGWYRRELKLPRRAPGTRWIARFEGAGHGTTVYLNGRRVGHHTGNYLPFEVDLTRLRPGRNRLTVRVSSLRTPDDLTHWRKARFHRWGNGGWWNFGGIHREVTLRPARGLDVTRAQALTRMACPSCAARVQVRATIRNLSARRSRPEVVARAAGQTVRFAPVTLAPGARRELVAELTIRRPRLWDIGKGNLYDLSVAARGAGARVSYDTRFGVRDLRKDAEGRVSLNGRPLRTRGISLHEDDARVGSAWRVPQMRELLRRVTDLRANAVRSHYPLNPYVMEELDRRGVLVWDTAPVNIVQNDRWAKPSVRRAAVRASEEMVLRDRGHPSVMAFSIADELPIPVRQGQIDFIRAAAARVRALDPTRMVALDRVARFGAPDDADPAFRTFDALGINEYFGWYRGALAPRPPAYARELGAYYDRLHALQPGAALFVTEFGAEANRGGPVRRKGTYAYQSRFLRRHLAESVAKPYLNGAFVWALRDFRVHGAWTGGNPRPHPPWNQKGLIDYRGRPKPGYDTVRDIYAGWARGSP